MKRILLVFVLALLTAGVAGGEGSHGGSLLGGGKRTKLKYFTGTLPPTRGMFKQRRKVSIC